MYMYIPDPVYPRDLLRMGWVPQEYPSTLYFAGIWYLLAYLPMQCTY